MVIETDRRDVKGWNGDGHVIEKDEACNDFEDVVV